MWEPELNDWGKVNTEAYKVMFDQAKARFEEHIGNSEDITNKSEKLALGIFTFIAAFAGFSPKIEIGPYSLIWLSILFLTCIFFLGKLLFPKETILRGSSPKEILTDDFDCATWTIEEQEKLLYYRELVRYEEKIKQMVEKHKGRILYFKIALIASLAFLISLATVIIGNVSHL